jgi:transcriptional regulator with XRE-family HTH domain
MIGRELKEIIQKRKLTYRKVAEELKIDHASLYRSLVNDGNPEWKTIEKLLNYLGYDFKLVERKEVRREKSTHLALRAKAQDIPFDKLKAPSTAEGLSLPAGRQGVDTERRFLPRFRNRGSPRMYQSHHVRDRTKGGG